MTINFLLLSLLIFESKNLQCGEENIEHCLERGTGTEINSCKTCEDKYFPFLDNVLAFLAMIADMVNLVVAVNATILSYLIQNIIMILILSFLAWMDAKKDIII